MLKKNKYFFLEKNDFICKNFYCLTLKKNYTDKLNRSEKLFEKDEIWLNRSVSLQQEFFHCQICKLNFKHSLSYQFHQMGLAHMKAFLDNLPFNSFSVINESQQVILGKQFVTEYHHTYPTPKKFYSCRLCGNYYPNFESLLRHTSSKEHILIFLFSEYRDIFSSLIQNEYNDYDSRFLDSSGFQKTKDSSKNKISSYNYNPVIMRREVMKLFYEGGQSKKKACVIFQKGKCWINVEGNNHPFEDNFYCYRKNSLSISENNYPLFKEFLISIEKNILMSNLYSPAYNLSQFSKKFVFKLMSDVKVKTQKDLRNCLDILNVLIKCLLSYRLKMSYSFNHKDSPLMRKKLKTLKERSHDIEAFSKL